MYLAVAGRLLPVPMSVERIAVETLRRPASESEEGYD